MRIVRQPSFSPSNRWTLPAGSSPMPTNEIDREQRGEAADGRGQRAEHAQLRAIVAILGVERIADEAAIAGPGAEQPDLPLELHRGRRDQRNAERDAGVADRQPRREIVAAVDDQVVAAEQLVGIVRVDPLLDRLRVDEMVEPLHELQRQLRLGLAGIALRGTAAGGGDWRARRHHRR